MKQIDVQIMQQSYVLGCPEGHESRMLEAVERVDSAMNRIRDAGKVRARERIAVLAALNMAFEISDHETAALAAQAHAAALAQQIADTPAPVPVAIEAPASGGETFVNNEEDEARLQSLIKRLDETLGDDGRLF